MKKKEKTKEQSLDRIPMLQDFAGVYLSVSTKEQGPDFFKVLDNLTDLSDQTLANWLNITTRTLHNYRIKPTTLKSNTKEHILLLLSLYRHGVDTFGKKDLFEQWLSTKNQLLDNRAPKEFLDTISGIHFIDNRLTAIDYGENV